MGFLHMPKASRKVQKTLKNLRVSVLCFILTFLVLRNLVGAGKFGTPAQDFEEIRQHLQNVRMHRMHHRVLAEVLEEEKKQEEAPLLTPVKRFEERVRPLNAPLRVIDEEQGNVLIGRHGRALQGGSVKENVGLQRVIEGSRSVRGVEQPQDKEDPVHTGYGTTGVLLIAGVQSSGCQNPAGEHFLLKSLENKADYAALHGLEISLSFCGVDLETSKPLSKLLLLQRTMERDPHVEWLWWMPGGALIADMAYTFSVEDYAEFNLVFLGSNVKSFRQKSSINLNTDTFLIRNCQWSLNLLRRCVRTDLDQASRFVSNYLLEGPLGQVHDQCALISRSVEKQEDIARKIYVQQAAVLSGYWRDVVEEVERVVRIGGEKLPFVTHFLECDACKSRENEECMTRIEKVMLSAAKQRRRSNVLQQQGRSLV